MIDASQNAIVHAVVWLWASGVIILWYLIGPCRSQGDALDDNDDDAMNPEDTRSATNHLRYIPVGLNYKVGLSPATVHPESSAGPQVMRHRQRHAHLDVAGAVLRSILITSDSCTAITSVLALLGHGGPLRPCPLLSTADIEWGQVLSGSLLCAPLAQAGTLPSRLGGSLSSG